jgi:hypothetical protein
MPTRYIFAVLGGAFLLAAAIRLARNGWRIQPASRTWLIIGVIFSAVSWWI